MNIGGKAYGSRFSHDRLSASTAHAWESGTSDTNCGSLLLNLVANRSTCGWCHREYIALNTSGWSDHSVWMVWPSLDSLSAITFSRPGMWCALRITCFLVHQDRILHSRAHREPDFIPPPSLLIQATTVVLSVAINTVLLQQKFWNSFRARKTAFSSKWFMCNLLSGRDQVPLAVCSSKWAPYPSFDASVNICRACFRGCKGWPGSTLLSSSHHLRWGGATWELGSPCLVILGPSSCFSSATVWASCEVALGGLAFLLLWEDLWGTWTVRPDIPDRTVLTGSCLSRPANALVWVWPCLLLDRTGNLRSWKPVLEPALIFPCSLANLDLGRELPSSVCVVDKFRGTRLSPTSRLGTGGSLYPSVVPWVWPLWLPLWTPWELWRGQRVGLWIGRTDPGGENACTSWIDCE